MGLRRVEVATGKVTTLSAGVSSSHVAVKELSRGLGCRRAVAFAADPRRRRVLIVGTGHESALEDETYDFYQMRVKPKRRREL